MKKLEFLGDHGKRFTALIDGERTEGVVTVENGNIYLCQNNYDGIPCNDLQGYEYSLCLFPWASDTEMSTLVEKLVIMNQSKQLIGYKLLIDLPDVKKGSLFTPTTEMWMDRYPFYRYINELGDQSASKYTEPFLKDHPNWFEPVYEVVKPDIIIDGYTMETGSDPVYVKFGCVTVERLYLKDAYDSLKNTIKEGDRKIGGVYLSNGTKISLDKIKEILDY